MTDAHDEIWVGAAYGKDVGVDWSTDKVFKNDIKYTRADIHATALARIDEAENQLDSARHSVTVLEAKGAVSQARIAELEAALTRAVQIAENYATVYSEGKPDDWEDRADNMMWGMHRDIAALKAKP